MKVFLFPIKLYRQRIKLIIFTKLKNCSMGGSIKFIYYAGALLLIFSLLFPEFIYSQDGNLETNEAMKGIFKEAKKDNSNFTSILMITGVICIVGVAMYLGFKGDESEKRT
jgi:hypothetical protein